MTRRNAVVIVADERQFPPAVFFADRLRSLNGRADTDIIIASNAPDSLAEARAYDADLQLLDLSSVDHGRRLPVSSYFTRATYLRLFLPRLLRETHARVLYLDADIYAESAAVFGLFDLDMEGHAVAAVRDPHVPFLPNAFNASELETTMRVKGNRFEGLYGLKYLNGGVELFDVDAFIDAEIERKAMDLLRGRLSNPQVVDQSLLNAVLRGNWLELSPACNMLLRVWNSPARQIFPPVLTHFTGDVKPWHYAFADKHPARDALMAFLRDSPWRAFLDTANPAASPFSRSGSGRPQQPLWVGEGLAAFLRYLKTTRFADVAQGITQVAPGPVAAA